MSIDKIKIVQVVGDNFLGANYFFGIKNFFDKVESPKIDYFYYNNKFSGFNPNEMKEEFFLNHGFFFDNISRMVLGNLNNLYDMSYFSDEELNEDYYLAVKKMKSYRKNLDEMNKKIGKLQHKLIYENDLEAKRNLSELIMEKEDFLNDISPFINRKNFYDYAVSYFSFFSNAEEADFNMIYSSEVEKEVDFCKKEFRGKEFDFKGFNDYLLKIYGIL